MWKHGGAVFVSTLFWGYVFSEPCTTPAGKSSNCVFLYDCPELAAGLQKPVSGVIASYIQQSSCGVEGRSPKVCCGPLPGAPTTTTEFHFDNYNDANVPEDSLLAPANECAIDTNGERIFGGVDTDLDEFPFMALLGYRNIHLGKTVYRCGGALINHRYILTAAHCVVGEIERKDGQLITVRLGEYDTSKAIDCVNKVCADSPQEIEVASTYAHPGYSDKDENRRDDIALVRLAKRATYSHYVKPICLADDTVSLDTGLEVVIAGWGKTLNLTSSNVKQKLYMTIYDKEECTTKFCEILNFVVGEKQVCAGGERGKDSCKGDSGGPLMKKRRDGIWDAVGVLSSGLKNCGQDGWPGIYTSVASYRDWITTKLRISNRKY